MQFSWQHTRTFIAASLLAAAALAAPGAAQAQTETREFNPLVGQEGKDVIWVPTPQALVERMLEMAKTTPQDYVVDLGSGDGRTVITAAKKYGVRALGIEYNADMVALSKRNAAQEGVADRAQFMQGDIFQTDFSKATVLTLYLLPALNLKLRPTILRMKPGTRVVSHAFSMGDWQPDQIETVEGRTAYLWIVPAQVEGSWRWGGPRKFEMLVQQHFQQVEGLVKIDARAAQFRDARLQGDRISFSVIEYSGMGNVQHDYTGRVNGDVMAGTVKRSDAGGEEKWSAKRVAGPDAAQRSAR
ncbi:MAG TPA: class I SAM-dependent methyltransferase [Burkholderiales bacterium]|nr:class I SAM-dependent methyltransferase [Burkholderiales bacterium]